jgi:hypothetical protein
MYKILITTTLSSKCLRTNIIKFPTRKEADEAIERVGSSGVNHGYRPFTQSAKPLYK